jgi:nucleotide-binding universal stress UspA family protein
MTRDVIAGGSIMADWKKVCCAVDFSEMSRLTMEQAAAIAKRWDASLTLVHVVAPPPLPATEMFATARELSEAALAEEAAVVGLERTLQKWQLDAEVLFGKKVEATVLAGHPADEIVRYARDEGVDLLVVGTHGRTGFRRAIVGSVAEEVARLAPCPVLLARARAPSAQELEDEEAALYR